MLDLRQRPHLEILNPNALYLAELPWSEKGGAGYTANHIPFYRTTLEVTISLEYAMSTSFYPDASCYSLYRS